MKGSSLRPSLNPDEVTTMTKSEPEQTVSPEAPTPKKRGLLTTMAFSQVGIGLAAIAVQAAVFVEVAKPKLPPSQGD